MTIKPYDSAVPMLQIERKICSQFAPSNQLAPHKYGASRYPALSAKLGGYLLAPGSDSTE